jgi:hypothetical protein
MEAGENARTYAQRIHVHLLAERQILPGDTTGYYQFQQAFYNSCVTSTLRQGLDAIESSAILNSIWGNLTQEEKDEWSMG